jgi:hypothetical protein
MTAPKKGITRKSAVKSTKYVQTRNITLYMNGLKRSDQDGRQDTFMMTDDEELIEYADAMREDAVLTTKEIALELFLTIAEEGNINMTFGDTPKATAASTGKFNTADRLAAMRASRA